MDFQLSIVVERPVEEAFRACVDPAQQVRWVGSLVEVRVEPGQPWGAGSRFTQVHEEAGMRQELEGELLAYAPDELIRTRLQHSQFALESELRFEDLGVRCRITQVTSIELLSMMLKVMKGTIRSTLEQRMHDDFERLRVLLESGG